jgi:hypothetical protein
MTLDALDLSGHLRVGQSVALLVVMFFFGLLFKYTTDLAREQISGMPTLDLHDTGRLAGRAAGTAASMVGGIGTVALGTLGGSRLARMAGSTAGNTIASQPATLPGTASSGESGAGGEPGNGMGGGPGIAGAPASAVRLLARPPIDAAWTEARDLPKSAARLLEAQRALPPPPRQLPPPRS